MSTSSCDGPTGVPCSSLRAKLRAAKWVGASSHASEATDSVEPSSSSNVSGQVHCDVEQHPNLVDPHTQLKISAPADVESHMGLGPVEGCAYNIVLLLPDVQGGEAIDTACSIFSMAAEEIVQFHAVDCYQLRWMHASPSEPYALSCVIRVIKDALDNAQRRSSKPMSHFKIFLAGHAFGGAIATKAACLLSSQFDYSTPGRTSIEVDCLCTLDAPAAVQDVPPGCLAQVRRLRIVGGLADAAGSEACDETIREPPRKEKEKERMVFPAGAQRQLLAVLVGHVLEGMLET